MKRRHFGLPTDDDGGLVCEYFSVVGWVDGRSFGWCLLGIGDVLAGDCHSAVMVVRAGMVWWVGDVMRVVAGRGWSDDAAVGAERPIRAAAGC